MTKTLQVYFKLMKDVRLFHKYCDPVNMTYEDHLVWEKYNKLFHPENYTEEELKSG